MLLFELFDQFSMKWKWDGGRYGNPHTLKLLDAQNEEIGHVKWITDDDAEVAYVHGAVIFPDELRSKGLGKQMYLKSFEHLKERYKFARASTRISKTATYVWESLENSGKAYKIKSKHNDNETWCVNLLHPSVKEAPYDWKL